MKKLSLLLTLVIVLVFNMVACKKTDTNEGTDGIGNERNIADKVDDTLEGVKDNLENAGENIEDNVEDIFDRNPVDEDAFVPVDVSAGGWNIIIEDIIIEDSLENVDVVLGYTDATTNKFVKEAASDHEFVLLKLNISKHDSKETLKWDKFTLTDNLGNEYKRIDDAFIKDLGMVRMSGTDLNFGTNEGWIAFEVKEDAETLTLNYKFENETLTYTLGD